MTWKSLLHPNVLPLLGVTMSHKHFAMVSEWMANGNINEFLRGNRDADRFELVKRHSCFLPDLTLMMPSHSLKGSLAG